MKTFDPPLEALAGETITGVRRVGKMPILEFGDLALLIHLMSAGRLRVFDKRASAKDRASRVLIRLEDGRELRLREFGTKQRAWAKLLPVDGISDDEAVARLGRKPGPRPRRPSLRRSSTSPVICIHCSATRPTSPESAAPGSTRSSGRRGSRPSEKAQIWIAARSSACTRRSACSARRSITTRRRSASSSPTRRPSRCGSPQARGRALPALRHDARGGVLLRAPDHLLPRGADRRSGAEGPAPLATTQIAGGSWRPKGTPWSSRQE